jgi:hypothetical protein
MGAQPQSPLSLEVAAEVRMVLQVAGLEPQVTDRLNSYRISRKTLFLLQPSLRSLDKIGPCSLPPSLLYGTIQRQPHAPTQRISQEFLICEKPLCHRQRSSRAERPVLILRASFAQRAAQSRDLSSTQPSFSVAEVASPLAFFPNSP